MKTVKYIFSLLVGAAILSSCEEVIEINLNDSDSAFVVEAILNSDSLAIVRLTQTANYFSDEELEIIENARIILSDGSLSEELVYMGEGYYSGSLIYGNEDTDYSIDISVNGANYLGNCYMPKKTKIFSLKVVESTFGNQKEEAKYQLECKFKDHPGIDEFFIVRYTQNGELLNEGYNLIKDFLAVNDTITYSGFGQTFDLGDEVNVKVYSIDEDLYNYFSQLDDAIGDGMFGSSTPYNPQSNINNGALGYFAAWIYVNQTIEIRE